MRRGPELVTERVAFRPVRGASAATLLITSFAVSYLLQSAARLVFTSLPKSADIDPLLHRFDTGPFDEKVQLGRLEYLRRSEAAAKSLAENYAGLPYGW